MLRIHEKAGLAAAAAVLAFGLTGTASALDWQQAKGSKLFLGMNKHAYTDAITPLIPEFESLTGKTAWATLWRALNSRSLLRVGSLPYATDLRIDR